MIDATARRQFLAGLFANIDAKNTAAFLDHLAPGASFRFGSAPAVKGREAVGAAVDGFFETIAGLSHSVAASIADGNTLVCEGEVTYTRHDESTVTLPFVDVFEMDGESIAAYKIYMDVNPLYADQA